MNTRRDVLLEELVSDAKLIAAYGHRAGLFKNTELLEAIGAVEKLEEKKWSCEEFVRLQDRMNAAIRDIAPVTLIDLKSGWKPFSDVGRHGGRKLLFAMLTCLLMVMTAYGSFSHNYGRVILAELERLEKEYPQEKIGRIIQQVLASDGTMVRLRPVQSGLVGAVISTPTAISGGDISIVTEANFQLLNQWKDIDRRIEQYTQMAVKYGGKQKLTWLTGLLFGGEPEKQSGLDFMQFICNEDGAKPEVAAMISRPFFELSLGMSALGSHIVKGKMQGTGLACSQGVKYTPENIPNLELLTLDVRNIVSVFELWILPALFGALGSAIYFLRAVLNPLLRDPAPSLVVHRMALGAFAGIILAWFWTPAAGLGGGGSVGLSLFGAAFLVGFSIDVFFALLDRLVTLSVGAIGRMGAAADSKNG